MNSSARTRAWLSSLRRELGHAFRLPSRRPLTEAERGIVERLADQIVRRRLGVPAAFFIESVAPLHFVGSQVLAFLSPVVQAVFGADRVEGVVALLEKPGALETLRAEIESRTASAGQGAQRP